jgi:hypothetical protein
VTKMLKYSFKILFINSRSVFSQKHITFCIKDRPKHFDSLTCVSDVGWAGGYRESSGH